jgi:hypothetical protein
VPLLVLLQQQADAAAEEQRKKRARPGSGPVPAAAGRAQLQAQQQAHLQQQQQQQQQQQLLGPSHACWQDLERIVEQVLPQHNNAVFFLLLSKVVKQVAMRCARSPTPAAEPCAALRPARCPLPCCPLHRCPLPGALTLSPSC